MERASARRGPGAGVSGACAARPARRYGSLTFETVFVAVFSVNSITLPAWSRTRRTTELTVQDVRAHVSLDANAMNFVQITAGVDVAIRKVQLSISGVLAEAYLYVDLDNVARIVDRVVLTLDRNSEILTQVLQAVDTTVNAATGAATRRR